ncbi:MAG TPA: PLD nuclease N-terminal domain-containing protein [Ktedonobacterales bacterium]|nr:PLD nuclease N-terminal domain-containing protein [Ktedonobacterales bacterium]
MDRRVPVSRQGPGCLFSTLLTLVIVLLPLVGHIILTVYILDDFLSLPEKAIWLVIVWAVPILGPLLYLLIGQRRNRVLGQAFAAR